MNYRKALKRISLIAWHAIAVTLFLRSIEPYMAKSGILFKTRIQYRAGYHLLMALLIVTGMGMQAIPAMAYHPTAGADTYRAEIGATLHKSAVDGVLANDTDADNDKISAVLVADVSNGTLMLNSDGSFIYIHDGSQRLSDNFTYRAFDGLDYSNIATVSITIDTAWPTNGWISATPAEMGMDQIKLEEARDYALTGAGSGFITRGGKLVMSWGSLSQLYDLKSTTKSIGITILGLAMADGVADINDPAQIHLPGVGVPPQQNENTGWLDGIRLLHLATHTAGFDKPGGYINLLFEPGTTWAYSDGGANWLADILTVRYGQDLNDIIFERVFNKLGITDLDITWRDNLHRHDTINGIKRREIGSGISANVDAMARIGYLYLRQGIWDKERILPEDFTAQVGHPATSIAGLPVFQPEAYFAASDHYGLLWWNNGDGAIDGVPPDAYWSWGLYESFIIVIPSLDIVAARAGNSWREGWDGDYAIVESFIKPIVESVHGNPPNQTPVVDAGFDQTITLPDNTANLSGTAIDDGLPGSMSTTWSVLSGPGNVIFSNAGALGTMATFSALGTYVLQLTADDSELAVSDDVTITVGAELDLTEIVITPQAVDILTGATLQFIASGLDSYGDPIAITPDWGVTGGIISENGLFTAGLTTGPFTVTATDGFISGEATFNINDFSAPRRNYLEFDGIDDKVVVSDNDILDITEALTLEAWIRPNAIPYSRRQARVISKGVDYEITVSGKDSGCIGDGDVQWRATIDGINQRICGGQLSMGAWQHVAGVYDGNEFSLYVDGLKVAGEMRSGLMATNETPLEIGNLPESDRYFDGAIDEVRIWSRALTQSEIQNNMYVELNGTEPGLTAYYKFNEDSEQTAFDSSTNGNDGIRGAIPEDDDDDPERASFAPPQSQPPPYPASPLITGLNWAPAGTILRKAQGSDNWPTTWADDDSLYTVYGDGWGFEPYVTEKLSLGFANVSGSATDFTGINIRSPSGEFYGGGSQGKKGSGLLMVDGIVYMWVRNANEDGEACQLAWSSDHAETWTWSDWAFSEFGYCTFINFGKNYEGARDNYVYMVSHDNPSAYEASDHMILARVDKNEVTYRAAYEFYQSTDLAGNPVWTSDINERGAVFTHVGHSLRSGISYNPGVGRYLWWQQFSEDTVDTRVTGGFGIYDAPEPWGPWTTVYFTEHWDVGPGETAHFPTKWMSPDGQILYLIFSGKDYFSVRQATLDLDSDLIPPSISIIDPPDNATVTDTIKLSADAADDVTVAYVEFQVDGYTIATVLSAPFETTWNTAMVDNGLHTIFAIATDTSARKTSAFVHLMVDNFIAPDTPDPAVEAGENQPLDSVPTDANVPDDGLLNSVTDTQQSQVSDPVDQPVFNDPSAEQTAPPSSSVKDNELATGDQRTKFVNTCYGDFEPDGDVDGSDLNGYINIDKAIALNHLANEFGSIECN
jgi:CubicO group peptidase (beta-lactamase class C family)